MDDATRLICQLQTKLTELDGRIAAYHIEMAAEFTRYSEKLLQNVPEDVSHRVNQAITRSLSKYSSLSSHSLKSPQSPPPSTDSTNSNSLTGQTRASPPAAPLRTPETSPDQDEQPPRSPHQREQEFRGLFTPSFLPLLETTDRPQHSPPPSPTLTRSIDAKLAEGNTQSSEDSRTVRSPSPTRRPSHGTASSVDSVDSVGSDSSTGKRRKSALKVHSRSSSYSKPAQSPRSPRRVRFDFEGEEVLPSSSPQATTPAPIEGGGATESKSAASTDNSYNGISLGDIEGEEEAPPKKVSSSQALRALSKEPLQDGTLWRVVNSSADPEDSSAPRREEIDTAMGSNSSEETLKPQTMPPQQLPERPEAQAPGKATDPKSDTAYQDTEDQQDASDDDEGETLFIRSKKKKKKKKKAPQAPKVSSPIAAQAIPVNTAARSATPIESAYAPAKLSQAHLTQEEEDDLFVLDADDDDESLRRVTSARISAKKHAVQVTEEETEPEPVSNIPPPISSSPAVNIPLPRSSPNTSEEQRIPPRVLPVPRGPIPTTSVGSYKGVALNMGPLKDIKAQERTLAKERDGEVPAFFVGSVNGRSGPDASNTKSYRASIQSPTLTGMPGSLTDRLLRDRFIKGNDDSDEEETK